MYHDKCTSPFRATFETANENRVQFTVVPKSIHEIRKLALLLHCRRRRRCRPNVYGINNEIILIMREMNDSHSTKIARPPNDRITFDVNQNIFLIISIHRERERKKWLPHTARVSKNQESKRKKKTKFESKNRNFPQV